MSPNDTIILMGAGGGFILLGIIGILWGRYEEKRLFEALAEKRDTGSFPSNTSILLSRVPCVSGVGLLSPWEFSCS